MEVSIVFITFFIVVFGIFYLFYSTRHKERLALIEKDKDVNVFIGKRVVKSHIVWKIILLNLSLLLMGIGFGILLGQLLYSSGMQDEVAYPASIFIMSGIGLFSGFYITKSMIKQ